MTHDRGFKDAFSIGLPMFEVIRIVGFWPVCLTFISFYENRWKFSGDVFVILGLFWTLPVLLLLGLAYGLESIVIKFKQPLLALPLGPIFGIIPSLLLPSAAQSGFGGIWFGIGLFWTLTSFPRIARAYSRESGATD